MHTPLMLTWKTHLLNGNLDPSGESLLILHLVIKLLLSGRILGVRDTALLLSLNALSTT